MSVCVKINEKLTVNYKYIISNFYCLKYVAVFRTLLLEINYMFLPYNGD